MALTRQPCPIPAKDWWFEILDPFRPDLTVDLWIPINGITSFDFTGDMSTADASDFSADGWTRATVTQRGRALSLETNYNADKVTGERDRGQFLLEWHSKQTGCDADATIRMFDPTGRGKVFFGLVNTSSTGGGVTDKTSVGYEITVNGKPDELPYIQVVDITLDETSITLDPGDTATITATVLPVTASNQTVTWISSNEAVAIVDETGLVVTVMGAGEGTCTIIARTANNNKQAELSVTVTSGANVKPVTAIVANPNTLTIAAGSDDTFSVDFTPTDATNKAINVSSDTAGVTATTTGNVVTVAVSSSVTSGTTATITVTSVSGGHITTCEVTTT
jgi:Bacterial surface proteins containing Ig-like domains